MKRFIGVVLALMMIVVAGCSSSKPAAAPSTQPAVPQPAVPQKQTPVALRFLTNETDPPTVKFYEAAIAAFQKENPGVTVELEAVSTDGRLQKLAAGLNAKTIADVIKIMPEEMTQYAEKGYLVPLDDIISTVGASDFVPGVLTPVNGKNYAIPYAVGQYIMWYRDDLLKAKGLKPPATTDDLLQNAKALTTGGKFGFVLPAGENRATSIFFTIFFWSNGGTYFDKNLNLTFDSQAAVDALKFMKQLQPSMPPSIASYSYNDLIDTYIADKVAMSPYAGRLLSRVNDNAPALMPNTRAVAWPKGPKAQVSFASIDGYGVTSTAVGAKNPEVAKKFVTYLTTGQRGVDFALTAFPHLIPPLKSVQDALLKVNNPILKDHADDVKAVFGFANALTFNTEAGATIQNGRLTSAGIFNPKIGPILARNIPAQVVQKVLIQNVAPEEAVKWGAAEMKKVLDENK